MSDIPLYDIVIVGAGPAGVSLAYEAVQMGIDPKLVLVLEKGADVAESIRNFYPDDKLVTANYKGFIQACVGSLCITDMSKDEALSYLLDKLEESGVSVEFKQEVKSIHKDLNGYFSIHTMKDIFVSKTVAIAIGMLGNPNRPDYDLPLELKDRVHFKVPSHLEGKQKIMVVGGGDSASEFVQSLVKKGHETVLCYRRESFGRMNELNRKFLEEGSQAQKLRLYMSSNIEKIENADGQVRAYFMEDREAELFDHLIFALGGTKPKEFLGQLGIELKDSTPVVDQEGESSIKGLFMLGDLAIGSGGGSINLAFNNAYKVIQGICVSHLDCKLPSSR